MDAQRNNVEELFSQALQKDPAERQAFLESTCTDKKVHARVEALLKAHDNAGDFLEGPAIKPANLADTHFSANDGNGATVVQNTLDFLDRCDTPDRLGLLAHYEILDIIGRGGMGIVLRGADTKLNRTVAIKVLAPQLAADLTARQRFRREAQAVAAVSHPHVVVVHAVDEFRGLPYLAMEYVSGSSLQQKIDEGGGAPLSQIQILRISMQIASGLAAAHAQGLIHRDIKPANILLENGIERVKITDFGLARSLDDVRVTQAGAVYGTPQYMSPEQAQGERVDQRSDLFSLGSVMYALCTGRPPFRGDTGLAVLKRVCEDTPQPIREINPNITQPLAAIVNKLLAKNPDARFQTAGEVADALSRYLAHLQHDPHAPYEDEKPHSPEAPKNRQWRWPIVIIAAIALLGVGVFAMLEGNRRAPIANHPTTADPKVTKTPATKHGPGAIDRPVKVFILAGDSNMSGRAKVSLLKFQANQAESKERFQHLLRDGEWVVREDVWVKNFHQKGNLTVGFGDTADRFGPELEFGHVVGDRLDEQVLLIKTCWGGHDLNRQFRSPGAGLPPLEILEQMVKELQKSKADVTIADVEKRFGTSYRAMLAEIRDTLTNLDKHFPGYRGQGYEIAGFVWFSGWNDMITNNPFYTDQLAHFIRDLRVEFGVPKLPFVIGQMGVHGISKPGSNEADFRAAQAGVAQLPEFAGNVKLVPTDPFWDYAAEAVYKKGWRDHQEEWDRVGSDLPFHYLGSAKTFSAIGRAFGEAIMELMPSKRERLP